MDEPVGNRSEITSNNEVGYGRPPVRTRFVKGRSGNPKGRPKGTRNLVTDLNEELSEPVMVREGDRLTRCSKQRAIVKKLVNEAAKGDMRAISQLVALYLRTPESTGPDEAFAPLADEDRAMLAGLYARLQQADARAR